MGSVEKYIIRSCTSIIFFSYAQIRNSYMCMSKLDNSQRANQSHTLGKLSCQNNMYRIVSKTNLKLYNRAPTNSKMNIVKKWERENYFLLQSALWRTEWYKNIWFELSSCRGFLTNFEEHCRPFHESNVPQGRIRIPQITEKNLVK